MTAETFYATDGSSVEYLFVDDEHPEVDSGWISFLVGEPVTWIDNVPVAEATYFYSVIARNSGNGHETDLSEIIEVNPFVSTLFPTTPVWVTPPSAQPNIGTIEMEVKQVVDLEDPNSEIWYYFASWLYDGVVETETGSSGWTTERVYTLSGLTDGEYRFSVKAGNGPFSDAGDPIFQTEYSAVQGATVEWKLIPDSMTWKAQPHQMTVGEPGFIVGAIAMEVEPIFDPNDDPVEYYFSHWLVDGEEEGSHSSGWQASPRYITGMLLTGEYRFSVRARSRNAENGESQILVVTVDRAPPTPSPMSFSIAPHYINPGNLTGTAAMIALEAADASGGVQYWFECTNFAPFSSKSWQTSPLYEVLVGRKQTFLFRVKARDRFGNETGWSQQLAMQ